ncbi:hypothetical protein MiSe_25470 [Microseira wollei NIES-4236]|uniref:Uncharacterized protein n=1 Tax=Microseira wollei NIES-4236 TaxID=2530354 RepID=A0AAV3X670_9CYAN|nr:hypothetical protein MiSe_25470 [Microseira wollei NIES-4236]
MAIPYLNLIDKLAKYLAIFKITADCKSVRYSPWVSTSVRAPAHGARTLVEGVPHTAAIRYKIIKKYNSIILTTFPTFPTLWMLQL